MLPVVCLLLFNFGIFAAQSWDFLRSGLIESNSAVFMLFIQLNVGFLPYSISL